MTDSSSLSRRQFLQGAAAFGAFASIGSLPATARQFKPGSLAFPPTKAGWIDRAMRWANLTLIEKDPARFAPDYWLDLFKKARVDAACLSAGGYIAYYPTQVPLHYKSKYLNEGDDPFGYLVEGCRKLGIIVTGRLDTHAVHDDAARAHPEWIAVDEQGRKRRHWLYPEAWVTCCYGDYSFEYAPQIVEEVERLYKVDGIFINRWDNTGVCYCENCKRLFKEETGKLLAPVAGLASNNPVGSTNVAQRELPEGHPLKREWKAWRDRRMLAVWDLWDAPIRKLNPNARCIPNGVWQFDPEEVRKRADYLSLDKQGRSGGPIWVIGLDAKKGRSQIGAAKPLVAGFAFGPNDEFRWKASVHGRYGEAYLWAVEALANGLRPSIGITNAVLDDTRWVDETVELFSFIEKNQAYLCEQVPLARVALLQPAGGIDESARNGIYQALLEARIPFEVLSGKDVDSAETARRFKVLVLPNQVKLSDEECAQLTAFVKQGGSLVATFETSMQDGSGKRRKNFGLAGLFGVQYQGVQGPLHNTFMRLENDPQTGARHPILNGYDGADVIVNTARRVELKITDQLPAMPLTLVPGYPSLPMEELYAREERTQIPQVILREVGKGRVVYFPGNIDKFFDERLIEDHGRLIGNAVAWALNETPLVEVEGPGFYDVTAWRQQASMTVHLVNLNNAMTMRGYVREFVPSPPLTVRVPLPAGITARDVKLLVCEKDPQAKVEGGVLTLTVPTVKAHEVIAIRA